MGNQVIKLISKKKQGRLFLGDALYLKMIPDGGALIVNPKSSKENSEPFHEINGYEIKKQNLH
jgi:predicted mannosyl-3-phosphoglycerate phosphatase (HAD superfamily)